MTMRWINSSGGPLVLGEPDTMKCWRGLNGSSDIVSKDQEIDYHRACEVSDFLGSIACGTGQLLVFGDEPMKTTLDVDSTGQPTVIRWHSCRPELASHISDLIHSGEQIEKPIAFAIAGNRVVLADSTCDLTAADEQTLEFTIEPAEYSVTTERVGRADMYFFIVHRFLQK